MSNACEVRAHLLEAHRPAFQRALSCADAVAAGWDGDSTTDRSVVVEPFRAALRAADANEPLVAALVEAVEAAGHELAADPVADLPYLAVTGRGVVLRAPLMAGGRLVVTVRAFEVGPYRLGPDFPDALVVERREG